MLDEKNVLSDEELETVAGGMTRYYEQRTDPKKGDYYYVSWKEAQKTSGGGSYLSGSVSIAADKWEQYQARCQARGDVLLPMTK